VHKCIAAALLLVLLPLEAAAQSLADVQAAIGELQRAGVPIVDTECSKFQIANLVAFRLGWGLLHKAGGTRAVFRADGTCQSGDQSSDPEGFSTDYIIDPQTFAGRDVVTSTLGPAWPDPENAPDMVERNSHNYRRAFDPIVYLQRGAPAPAPIPPVISPQPPIAPQPASGVVEGILLAKVDALAARVEQMYLVATEHARADGDALASINRNVTEFRNEQTSRWDSIKPVISFTAKYLLPTVGTWYVCKTTGKCS
jgi:hypothetical protein